MESDRKGGYMTDYERQIFNSKCPYTNYFCRDNIPCVLCWVNEMEKEMMQSKEDNAGKKESEVSDANTCECP